MVEEALLKETPVTYLKGAPVTYFSASKPVWCPGCGNHGVSAAINKALGELGIAKEKVLMVSGIGCASIMPHQFSTYGMDSLHGRLVPVAVGANSPMTTLR